MFLPVERDENLPFFCMAHGQGPLNLGRIKGMERLRRLEHHEVGDIDDIVDGSQPNGLQTLSEPLGARANLHSVDTANAVEGRDCGVSDRGERSLLFQGGQFRSRIDQFTAAKGSGFTRDTEVS